MLLLCSLTTEPGLYTTDKYSHLLINISSYEYAKKKLRLVHPFCRERRHSDLSYASPNGESSLALGVALVTSVHI
jgi:hypothetical protein